MSEIHAKVNMAVFFLVPCNKVLPNTDLAGYPANNKKVCSFEFRIICSTVSPDIRPDIR